jgi:hypothetical protein
VSAEARSAAAALQHSFPSVGRCMTGSPGCSRSLATASMCPPRAHKSSQCRLGAKAGNGTRRTRGGEGPYCRRVRERWVRGAARRGMVHRAATVPGRRKPRRHRRSTRSCREYQLIKDSCYKLNRHVACARQKFRPLPHFGRRLCNANHLRFRRYPKVRLDHLPCRSSAYVSPVRAQWGADYFGLRPIDFIHRQSGRR